MPPRTRKGDDEPEEKPSRRGATTKGWGALAKKKKEREEREDAPEAIREFWLAEDEQALVQILNPEPYCMEGHNIKNGHGKWMFVPCQKSVQKHCLCCQDGIKTTWKAAFKVLDYRGEWDKDKKKFKNNAKIEKLWYCGEAVASMIKKVEDKLKAGDITDVVLDVSKVGSKKATTWTVVQARDEDDVRIKAVAWKEKFPPIEELCRPMDDDALEALGFTAE